MRDHIRVPMKTVSPPPDRFSRLGLLGWDAAILREAKIIMVGAGTLGNEVIKNLSLLGVGYLYIADFDTIEASNLSRSVLFRERDVDQKKAFVAALQAQMLNPKGRIIWFDGDINHELGAGVIRRASVVMGCVDNQAARLTINRLCRLTGTPWIDGALDGLDGLVRPFSGECGPCFECTMTSEDYADLQRRFSCQGVNLAVADQGVIPTTPTGAALIAALMTEMAVKLLHSRDIPFGTQIVYTNVHSELIKIAIKENDACLSHERAEPLVELSDVSAAQSTGAELLAAIRKISGFDVSIELNHEVATHLVCPECGTMEERIVPVHVLAPEDLQCPRCLLERTLISLHRIDEKAPFFKSALCAIGVRRGDILRVREEKRCRYMELTGDFPEAFF
jgi:molybdopterin/thiamine biosynthesis adenylyltransferase